MWFILHVNFYFICLVFATRLSRTSVAWVCRLSNLKERSLLQVAARPCRCRSHSFGFTNLGWQIHYHGCMGASMQSFSQSSTGRASQTMPAFNPKANKIRAGQWLELADVELVLESQSPEPIQVLLGKTSPWVNEVEESWRSSCMEAPSKQPRSYTPTLESSLASNLMTGPRS